jgi:predicted SAM-dependent methyltransferase
MAGVAAREAFERELLLSPFGARRLNWGSGPDTSPGWLRTDKGAWEGVQLVCDVLDGLPLEDGSFDYVVSIHALQEIPYKHVLRVLGELGRVIKPDGWLRLCLPDAVKGIEAYLRGDRDYFFVPDEDAASLGGKFVVHMLWYGHSRLLFTRDFVEELLLKAGFREVHHVGAWETVSPHPCIVELDDREEESLFVEAVK